MGIDPTNIIEPVQKALGPIGATLSDAWSAVIGDRVAAWRLANAAQLQLSVNDKVKTLGLSLDRSKIPERYAFAWFEEATKQDEPEIQELFARLLARAAGGNEAALDRRHLETLTRFTPSDAKVFEALFGPNSETIGEPSWDEYELWKALKEEVGEESDLSVEHLIVLGLINRTYSIRQSSRFSPFQTVDGMKQSDMAEEIGRSLEVICELEPTGLGIALYCACAPLPSEDDQ